MNPAQEVREIDPSQGMILPVAGDVCQDCGRAHAAYLPHDLTFRFRVVLYHRTGKSATWQDALAHCPDHVRDPWTSELKKRGWWDGPVTDDDMEQVRSNLSELSEKWQQDQQKLEF